MTPPLTTAPSPIASASSVAGRWASTYASVPTWPPAARHHQDVGPPMSDDGQKQTGADERGAPLPLTPSRRRWSGADARGGRRGRRTSRIARSAGGAAARRARGGQRDLFVPAASAAAAAPCAAYGARRRVAHASRESSWVVVAAAAADTSSAAAASRRRRRLGRLGRAALEAAEAEVGGAFVGPPSATQTASSARPWRSTATNQSSARAPGRQAAAASPPMKSATKRTCGAASDRHPVRVLTGCHPPSSNTFSPSLACGRTAIRRHTTEPSGLQQGALRRGADERTGADLDEVSVAAELKRRAPRRRRAARGSGRWGHRAAPLRERRAE